MRDARILPVTFVPFSYVPLPHMNGTLLFHPVNGSGCFITLLDIDTPVVFT